MTEIYRKKCKNPECDNPNVDIFGMLAGDEYYKDKKNKNRSYGLCKHCISKDRRHKQENSLYYILQQRTQKANSTAKKSNRKMEVCKIKVIESIALIISQNYICPATGIKLSDVFGELSLDHIVPDEKSGLNVIENMIFLHRTVNLGKNGDYMADALDIMLKIYLPNDSDKPLRDKRVKEIIDKIWDIQQIYPKVYETIKGFKRKKLTEILDNRLTVNDILNLS